MGGWRPRRPAGSARGTQGQLLLREDDRPGAAAERPRRPPAAGAANRRDRLRHGRKPGVLGRPLACAPAPGPGSTRGARARRGRVTPRLSAASAGDRGDGPA